MSKAKELPRRQRAVIEDLFAAEMDEQDVLNKHKVSGALYSRWLTDERFVEQFERRIAQAHHSGRLILARYATVAAFRLVELTNCKKEEIARRACLDIITLDSPAALSSRRATDDPPDTTSNDLPPETARRILAALAAPAGDAEVIPS